MSKFGLKIKNIEASTLYEYNKGIRDHYEFKNAMFTLSLFNDFVTENGLELATKESTRDIICLGFNYGTRSFEEEIAHLDKLIRKATSSGDENKLKKLNDIKDKAINNKSNYKKLSKEQLRTIYYRDGVDVEYKTYNKDGTENGSETIHYEMLYRSTGKAKKGYCMFVNSKFDEVLRDYIRMGLDIPYENAPIIEIGAYAPLLASTIIDKIHIPPENILILNDVESFFSTKVVSIETDQHKRCIAKTLNKYTLKNTLFDGQALIEASAVPEWSDGYVLLRQHMCKTAAVKTYIQKFFKEYFGDDYEEATVTDMFGNEHKAKDIVMITTDNAMKWLKFGVSYEYWCEWVNKNGGYFGIVKTAHKSKLGDVQRMSYQMINALDIETMDEVLKVSKDYVELLKRDDNKFLEYLRLNSNFSNDFDVLIALCEHNPDFVMSDYFRYRKKTILWTHVENLKTGKVIQNADNLVIFGSPYAMLLHSVGEDTNKDDTFYTEDDSIQCYTKRFDDGEYLAAFRSPFNSRNNLTYLHNKYNEKFDKYFDMGEQIIFVNLIETDFQDRNNGLI